jgi:gas vesicle protein
MIETSTEVKQEHGSFSSGLLVGFLVGAVGYFLTQTKEGKEIRDKFTGHWHDLRNNLIQEGKLKEEEKDIADYILAIRKKISEFLGETFDSQSSKKSTKKKSSKPRRKKLFKGI